jgi:hypothetical protein
MTMTVDLIADRYVAVWSEPDPEARRTAIAGLWAPDGVEFIEGVRFQGHEELDGRIARAYETFVASGEYTIPRAEDVTVHQDIVMFTVKLVTGDGEVGWAARVFLVLGEDGLIRQDYHVTVIPLAPR